jgi:hypothetical protein
MLPVPRVSTLGLSDGTTQATASGHEAKGSERTANASYSQAEKADLPGMSGRHYAVIIVKWYLRQSL